MLKACAVIQTHRGLLNISDSLAIDASGWLSTSGRGNVQKSPSSKAAAFLTRGAYSQYVSTAKGRHLSVRAASAKPGNAAGGFFQHSHRKRKQR